MRWSWDRRALGGRGLGCNPLQGLRWSACDSLEATAKDMRRVLERAPRKAQRPVLLRIGDVDVAFPTLSTAVKALQDICHDGSVADQSVACACARVGSGISTCAGSSIDVSNQVGPSIVASHKQQAESEADCPQTCAICIDDVMPGESQWELPCGHAFHGPCMHRWLLSGSVCPMCRCNLVGKTLQHGRKCC